MKHQALLTLCIAMAMSVTAVAGGKAAKDKTIKGNLNQNDQVHDYKMTKDQIHVIQQTSEDFDSYLYLRDANGNELAKNDDNVKLHSAIVFQAPKTATYKIVASSLGGRGTGAYTLKIRRPTIGGVIDAANKTRTHKVKLKAGTAYTIDLISNNFDCKLVLQDAGGTTLDSNDDAPGVGLTLNSRITFTPQKTGTYNLVCGPLFGRTGAYGVFVSPAPGK